MALNFTQLASNMGKAFWDVFKEEFPDIKDYAVGEAKKFAQSIVTIEKLHVLGKLTQKQAKLHIEIQKNAARMVFLTIEGLGLLAVEKAINAAFSVIRGVVNTAIGFALI